MIKIVTDQTEYQQAWELKEIDLLQSWQWGEIKKPKFEPIRLLVNDIPVTILVKNTGLFGLQYGYMPRAFHDKAFSQEDLNEFTQFCKANLNISHLIIDANLTNYRPESWAEYQNAFIDCGYLQTGVTIQPNQTNVIDLTETEEQLLLDMRPSSRRNINKAIKKGCKAQTFTNGDEAIERFFKVNQQVNAEARIKYTAYNFSYYKKVWDILTKENMARIYIITLDNQDIGAYFVTLTKSKLSELYGGVNKLGKSLRAGHLIKWHSIQEAKKLGLIEYDQWGVAPLLKKQAGSLHELNPALPSNELLTQDFDQKDKLAYISEFKFSFGGTYVEFLPQQLYIFKKTRYRLFRLFTMFSRFLR